MIVMGRVFLRVLHRAWCVACTHQSTAGTRVLEVYVLGLYWWQHLSFLCKAMFVPLTAGASSLSSRTVLYRVLSMLRLGIAAATVLEVALQRRPTPLACSCTISRSVSRILGSVAALLQCG